MQAQETQVALPMRSHTIFGVCEAIGEDFGFNPMWLRIPLAASVLLSLTGAIAAYLGLGLVVLASRLLFPDPKPTAVMQPADDSAANADQELPIAA
jgi:phage shock protein PspC (stress-responsive transcriptional regulator)